MRSITYVSSARTLFKRDELVSLLDQSRDANRMHGVTGMLLYKNGSFMQSIEGEHDIIGRLYQNICNDKRHHHVLTLLDETIPDREFAQWQMAFVDGANENVPPLEAYSDFMSMKQTRTDLRDDGSLAKKLLLNFREKAS